MQGSVVRFVPIRTLWLPPESEGGLPFAMTQTEATTMNWDQVEGNWKQMSGKAREKWGKLTDSDWQVVQGKKDQLVGRIQERYGIARDEAQREADDWAKRVMPATPLAPASTH